MLKWREDSVTAKTTASIRTRFCMRTKTTNYSLCIV